jgi:hypothetical protein
MKTIKTNLLLLIITFGLTTAQGQIVNGSFENGSDADLTNWKWTCFADSHNSAPAGGGNWSIKVWGGNTQGCFPGYVYQKLPTITDGQSFLLSAWGYAETAPLIGLYFGKINSGVITLLAGDTTSSTSWTALQIQSSFTLSPGDTALVILYGGLTGGPTQGYGYFDLVDLQTVSGITVLEQKQFLPFFPNPFISQTVLQTDQPFHNATLTVNNCFGQTVKQIKHISGQMVTLHRDQLPCGLYFIWLTQGNKLIASDKLVITDN